MRIDDTADQHDDLDTDSLFGSPPPSPGRGRSPSPVPLALPSGQDQDMSQNVGTLALPGSHLCSELPPALPPAPPLAAPPRPRPVTQVRRSSQDKSTTQAAKSRPSTASSRKKKPSRRPTPVVEAPPIQLPSPDEPLPPNFLRNQEALLGRAGLVAGVRPADLALQRQTRGQSASNPIVVEDESEQPMIGRRPLANRFPTQVTSVKPPSYEEIIQALVKQKNLVPVLHALLRVVTGSAQLSQYPPPLTGASTPAQGSTSQNYPYYPQSFTYPYGYYYPPLPSPGPSVSPHPSTNAGISRPPKRRRLSSVPAGASDWDVPYPFAEGQGPPNYRTNWEKERGKQLIEDLINLVKSAARKAAAKKVVDGVKKDETEQEELHASEGYPIGSVEYYKERVLSHYRPQTRNYGYESGCFPYQHWTRSSTPSVFPETSATLSRTRAATTSGVSSQLAISAATPAAAAPAPPSEPQAPSDTGRVAIPTQDAASVASNKPLPGPLLSSQEISLRQEERSQSEPPLPSTSHPPLVTPTESPQDNPQANLDDFLSFINSLPSDDLDALFAADFPRISNIGDGTSTNADPSTAQTPGTGPSTSASVDPDALPDFDLSSFTIDPALLALPLPDLSQDLASDGGEGSVASISGETEKVGAGQSQTEPASTLASDAASVAPPTPTLIGSPVSLCDLDPPTPHWDFTFPEPEIVGGGGGTGEAGSSGVAGGDRIVSRQGSSAGEGSAEGKPGKGKGRATEADLMQVDDSAHMQMQPQHSWRTTTGIAAPGTWQSEPTTASTSVATSRQSTPGPSTVVHPFMLPPPAAQSPSFGSPQPPSAESWPRTSYAHHLPAFLNLPTHGVAGARFARPAASARAKNIDREDVLNRARAMRAQIVGEIERAKVELWETTMEGGCLVALGKELDKVSGVHADGGPSPDVGAT